MTSALRKPILGDTVVLEDVPQGLLDGLPEEDQQAISEIVGKQVRLNEYVDNGRAELEFTDTEGVIHLIYVSPNIIKIA